MSAALVYDAEYSAGRAVEYSYDPATDSLVVCTQSFEDGGRTIVEARELIALIDCDVPVLADAIEYFDPSMLDNMSEDDSLRDWRIVFRSMFMRLADACDAEAVRP